MEKLKFPFWVEGAFGDDIWWGGAAGPDWSGGRRGNGREPDEIRSWGQECQMAGEGWQGQEGQMAVAGGGRTGGPDGRVVGQEADSREPDLAGADGQKGGMGGCMRARWQLLGVVGWHGAGV